MPEREPRQRKARPFTAKRAWDYLLFLLSRRSYTVAELRERLARRGLPAEEGEPLLERLRELSLVDDALYAEQYVRSRKGERGRLVLRRELRRKGVSEELVEGELAELSADQQAEAAEALLVKNAWRYRPQPSPAGGPVGHGSEGFEQAHARRQQRHKARSKAFAFLARRGFSADAAVRALEQVGWFGDEDD